LTDTALIPVPGKPRVLKPPKVAEGKLSNGLRVLVVRKPSVPRVEARMFLPVGGKGNQAADRVLASTLTTGTSTRGAYEIAQELQRLGAEVGASVDADNMHVGGSVLSVNLKRFFDLVAEFLTDATFPADELAVARDRIVQTVAIQRSQPEVVAQEALLRRLFGKHPYGRGLPEPEAVAKVSRVAATKRYREVAVPRGGVLVLVGDVNPPKTIELVASAFSRWKGRSSGSTEAPPALATGPTLIVDRPGSVQTNIRLAGSAPSPDSADAAAFEVANTIFGGYFISRFVENLRERNGYTYSPRSGVANRRLTSYVQIAAEVGTEVTMPSLVETHYELGRMVAKDVEESELVSAQRYLNGILSIRIQSQAGLASTLTGVVMHGLGVDYLRDQPRKIAAVTLDDVREASRRYLAPSKLVTVLVGDASKIASDVATLGDVDVQTAPGA
jgi:predicted Zn-dependent peptidase